MSDRSAVFERFRRGPELIAAAMTGAAGMEVDWAPEGKWTVRQIIAHLADCEIVLAERARRIIAEDNPVLRSFDQNLWASKLGYERRKPSESLDLFRRLRAANYELLRDASEETLARTCDHSLFGTVTLARLVELSAEHAEKHAQQIQDVRRQFKAAGSREAGAV